MSSRSTLLLIVAGAVAFGAAFMMRGFLGDEQQGPSEPRVLVAAIDIPQGSFIHTGKHLQWAEWPEEKIQKNFILEGTVNPEDYNGAVARQMVTRGTPVTENSVVKSHEGGFMAAVLKPNMRAVSIAVDSTSGNAGFIFPGDKVDLILTHSIRRRSLDGEQSEEVLASETFIENIRVLAVDQTVENEKNTAMLAKTITLEVTERQAEKINVAKDLGKISLSLRSLNKDDVDNAAEDDSKQKYTRDSDVSQIIGPRSSAAIKVKVIRGDESKEVEFDRN
ncbi:MAG: Flp pilus assembly protein CpaB [Rickettsiales bacterium]